MSAPDYKRTTRGELAGAFRTLPRANYLNYHGTRLFQAFCQAAIAVAGCHFKLPVMSLARPA